MNQTKKRLSIIKLAISITDIETIQLQVLKLGLLQTDLKIQEIITALQTENYAQAQGLITLYIEAPTKNVLQRTSQQKKPVMTTVEQTTVDEFQLFITGDKEESKTKIDINDFYTDASQTTKYAEKEITQEINLDDFLSDALNIETPQAKNKEEKKPKEEVIDMNDFFATTPTKEKEQTTREKTATEIDINDFLNDVRQVEPVQVKSSDFDALLNIDIDDVLPNNITVDISDHSHDTFFETPEQQKKKPLFSSTIPKDTFFDIEESVIHTTVTEETVTEENDVVEEIEQIIEKTSPSDYKAIPHIAQKLESMQKQYPPVEHDYENFSTVENLLKKISQETYSETEIEETLSYIKKLMEEAEHSQAAQLLLICAATESKFAQFMLARELYSGVLLTKNISEAFNLIHNLAMDDYAEALCDLGQFYENGIGTKKDKKRAQELYKEAMDLGIKRADVHHARIQKRHRRFFS